MDESERPTAYVENAEPFEACPGLPKARDFFAPICGNVQIPIGRQSFPSAPKIKFEPLCVLPTNTCDAMSFFLRTVPRRKVLLVTRRR
jgi:hypothetical protein